MDLLTHRPPRYVTRLSGDVGQVVDGVVHEVTPERTDGEHGAVAAPAAPLPLLTVDGGERHGDRLGRRRQLGRDDRRLLFAVALGDGSLVLVPVDENGSSSVSIRRRRRSNRRNTSRTWQAYSSGDHTSGCGRRRTSVVPRTSCQAAALSRTSSGMLSTSMDPGSSPHSGHARSSTHVQSLSSPGTSPSAITGPSCGWRTGNARGFPDVAPDPVRHHEPRPEGITTGTAGGPYRSPLRGGTNPSAVRAGPAGGNHVGVRAARPTPAEANDRECGRHSRSSASPVGDGTVR